jgi:iron(III)-salmochelin esterase
MPRASAPSGRARCLPEARTSAAALALALLIAVLVPGADHGVAQSRSDHVHHRHLRVDAPWGSTRVLVTYPRRRDGRDAPPGERWPVLVALHGQGEARRGPDRGFLGWAVDYRLPEAFGALGRGRVTVADFGGMVRPERLREVNAQLARRSFGGLLVITPYTPDLMAEPVGGPGIVQYADWLAGPMLAAVRAAHPNAATGRESTGIDGVSLGGMLALEAGLRHPEAFRTVGALQPAVRGREEALAALARPDDAQVIRLLTSDGDPFRGPTSTLSDRLRARHVPHDLAVVPGPHDYSFNRGPGGLEMLLFHDTHLPREPVAAR